MEHEDDFGIVGVTLANAFHVERVVAHGGFAIVYRGIHGGFRAPIALKCLRIPDGMTDEQHNTFLERFREEGELLFRLSAAIPEVVRPLHIDAVMLPTGQLMPFLALEWLEGEGFDAVIDRAMRERKTGLDLHLVIETLRPVAQALMRAHNFPTESGSLCVVHRDLKPENLFLCHVAGQPAIKVLDYGIAEAVSVAQKVSGRSSWGGFNPFTPGYGAPEQWAPDRFGPSGPWTDVWGLAITITEALLGKPPIDGELETMRRIALDPRRRPTPRGVGCGVSNDVEAVFQRAMALDPRGRTQSIEAFWTELERAAGMIPSIVQTSAPKSRRQRAERLLDDAGGEASIDLEFAVAPESLRAPPRAQMPSSAGSIPPPRETMPSARASQPSVRPPTPSTRPEVAHEASEVDLPTHEPLSQPAPASGPRSLRVAPLSALATPLSARATPLSARQPTSTTPPAPPSRAEEPPVSARGKGPSIAPPERVAVEREPGSAVSEVAEVFKSRFRAPGLLLAAAIGITLIDLALVRSEGTPLTLGPVKALWIAAPLAVLGAVLLVWKIVGDD